MSKLRRDVHAWAKRIRMSRSRIWAVVEGASHDVPFYESVLTDGGGLVGVEVIEASSLEIDGSSAGGKGHALKLMHALHATGSLQQSNNETNIDVLFFLDRDDDEYIGKMVHSEHVVYTSHADIEAEIVAHCDLKNAISRSFSVSRVEAAQLAPNDPLGQLASRWAEWIALRLASAECHWSDTRFAQPSGINRPIYGDVDDARVQSICARVAAACPDIWELAVARARDYVADSIESGDAGRLVKGKWVPGFIIYLIGQRAGEHRKLPAVSAPQFLTACLLSVDFRRVWLHYGPQVQSVLAR